MDVLSDSLSRANVIDTPEEAKAYLEAFLSTKDDQVGFENAMNDLMGCNSPALRICELLELSKPHYFLGQTAMAASQRIQSTLEAEVQAGNLAGLESFLCLSDEIFTDSEIIVCYANAIFSSPLLKSKFVSMASDLALQDKVSADQQFSQLIDQFGGDKVFRAVASVSRQELAAITDDVAADHIAGAEAKRTGGVKGPGIKE